MPQTHLSRELDLEAARNLQGIVLMGIPGVLVVHVWFYNLMPHWSLAVATMLGTAGTLIQFVGSRRFVNSTAQSDFMVLRLGAVVSSSAYAVYPLIGLRPEGTSDLLEMRVLMVSVTVLGAACATNAASRSLTFAFAGPVSIALIIGMVRNHSDIALFTGILIFLFMTDRAYRSMRSTTRRAYFERTRADMLAKQLSQTLAETERESLQDPLTGAGNRRLLARRYAEPTRTVSVLGIDLDHFKRLNDEHGHAVGDEMLVSVTRRIAEALRPQDQLIRVGGDEFMVIAETDEPGARTLAERILALIELPHHLSVGTLSLGACIGIAESEPGETLESAQRRADAALYGAKQAGRGGIEVGHEVALSATS